MMHAIICERSFKALNKVYNNTHSSETPKKNLHLIFPEKLRTYSTITFLLNNGRSIRNPKARSIGSDRRRVGAAMGPCAGSAQVSPNFCGADFKTRPSSRNHVYPTPRLRQPSTPTLTAPAGLILI